MYGKINLVTKRLCLKGHAHTFRVHFKKLDMSMKNCKVGKIF